MFGFLTSERQRTRKDAHNWLHLARKVLHFQRDQLPAVEIQALQQTTHDLRSQLKDDADAGKLKLAIERLEGCLRKSGGTHYPKSSLVDNVEFFLVALILFLGIRTFIVQPFKIPTNSMWPTYYGLTAEPYGEREEEPGAVEEAFRFLAFGASPRRVDAPVSGEVRIPWDSQGYVDHVDVSQRRWLILPGQATRYTLYVGGTPVTVTVPSDFRFEALIQRVFFDDDAEAMERARARAFEEKRRSHPFSSTPPLSPTGRQVEAGERVLSFDVMTGDQLFVDRVSYHFVRPTVGDGFVFRTNHIPWVENVFKSPARPKYADRYYIKRLVGVPGDTLEVREPVLYRNGAPIQGAEAFDENARQVPPYRGYSAVGLLEKGETLQVPSGSFFAMGDNSHNSSDGRYWGFVPAADVVGRPLWIYYPFTKRWGLAR